MLNKMKSMEEEQDWNDKYCNASAWEQELNAVIISIHF